MTPPDPESRVGPESPVGPEGHGASAGLTARLDERLAAPLRAGAFARRTWFSIALAFVLALHVGVLGWILWRDARDPPRVAQQQETPVEIVQEAPAPAAPKPSPKQQSAPEQAMEKPATSAPRAQNDETRETERTDKDTHAPKNAAPPAEGEPTSAELKPDESKPDEVKPDETKPLEKAETEPPKPPDVLQKDAEALDTLPPEPPKRPPTLPKPAPVKTARAKPKPDKPKPDKPRENSALQQLAGASSLPDYAFAKPMRKHAKVSGGSEDDRYLAVVYGMIVQKRPPIEAPAGEWAVAVSFVVDGSGQLVGAEISRSSGYPSVDDQALAAVEEAGPFPPPPSGGRTGLVARLRSVDGPTRYGER